ncbi:MAG TPA: hypothetical protein VJY43_03100 [Methanocorpusculum sp.]|nr:hypothetical protein [Methanocorpusculum sp.]
MTNTDKLNEIFVNCKDAASAAFNKASDLAISSSAGISASVKEMREKSELSMDTDKDTSDCSQDGDSPAAAKAGESVLSGELSACIPADETNAPSPVTVIKKCIHTKFDAFKSALHNRKLLITAGIMALVWFLLTLLPALGINPIPVQFFSFLTFAQGGLTGGVQGFIGGLIGKGLIAYFAALLLTGGISFGGIISSIKSFFTKFSGGTWNLASISPLLIGGGLALFIYNFLAGTSTLLNCMVGIVAFIIAARALMNKSGCIWNLFGSLSAKRSKIDSGVLTKVMAGWAAGFILGIVLSIFGGYLCYLIGFILLVIGAILMIVVTRKEGVAA